MTLESTFGGNDIRVGIIGLGYVGLPLTRAFWEAGLGVLGFDIDPEKVRTLAGGHSYLSSLGDALIQEMTASGRFEATDVFARLDEPSAIVICVPTPLDAHFAPDLSFVERTADAVAAALRPGQLVVLESTTYPGTTRDVVRPRLEASGLRCGKDFFLAYSPEREDPGNRAHTTRSIPKLVGGVDDASGRAATALYGQAVETVVPVRNAEVAESAKLLENIYRAVNIALANEMKVILTRMGVDIWEVIEAASTKPFGFQPFYPGPGLGGHCIPIDPFYLAWKARACATPTRFIELAGEINRAMPDYVVQRIMHALNERGQAVRGASILIMGLAYKPDVNDIRESPSIELIERLQELGASVEYTDPHVPTTHPMREHDLKMSSVEVTPERLQSYDCIVIATHHAAFDWQLVADHGRLIVDTRNVMRDVVGARGHVVGA